MTRRDNRDGNRPGMNLRATASRLLVEVVLHGRSLADVLPPVLESLHATRDRALVQELCYGVLRWYPRLDGIAAVLLEHPLKKRDTDVHCLLLTGLYQFIHLRVPEHAAIGETVAATRELGKPWAAGLLNAVLRRFQREADSVIPQAERDPAVAHAHPAWLLQALQQDWPADWETIVAANNARGPMCLRVNATCATRDEVLEELRTAGLSARPMDHTDTGICLESPIDIVLLPGFHAGRVSVQDGAAQLAAGLLSLAPGQRILDACAAPGGKTAHILETLTALGGAPPEVTALDIDADRLERLGAGLGRLNLQARLVCGDATTPASWWDGRRFDRILLDAPCSATGVIRRHPDIKLLRRPRDIATLARRQSQMLKALWPLLEPGGILLYATCSLLVRENAGVVTKFLVETGAMAEVPLQAGWGRPATVGRQILPGEGDMDGFYYACLQRQQ